jgi:hypothetical protein
VPATRRLTPSHHVAIRCALVHRFRMTSNWTGGQRTCTLRLSAISQFARPRIRAHLDYSIVHGPESMPPTYAATGIQPLAPDRSGGSASDVLLGPLSGSRPRANGHCRRCRVWRWARGYVLRKSTPHEFWLLQSTPPLPLATVCTVVQRIAASGIPPLRRLHPVRPLSPIGPLASVAASALPSVSMTGSAIQPRECRAMHRD